MQTNSSLSRRLVFLFLTLLVTTYSNAQFNENLEREILAVGEKYILDGIEKSEALNLLEDISAKLENDFLLANLAGKSWKYSHSVSPEGRKYRLGNGVLIYNFSENGEAYFINQNSQDKIWSSWEYDPNGLLIMKKYKSIDRVTSTQQYFYGIHSLTSDRLVMTKIIKSKSQTDKSAVLYNVYFRR